MKTTALPIITLTIAMALFSLGCAESGNDMGSLLLLAGSSAHQLSGDTSLSSSIGEVQGTAIVNIPFGTDLEDMRASITVAEGASFDVYDEDGETPAAVLTGISVIGVAAEDGTVAVYTLSILPDPSIAAEWSGFTPESPDYSIVGAQNVEGYEGNTDALYFDGDPATLDYLIAPDGDWLTLRDRGTVEVLVMPHSITPYAGIVHKGEKKDFSDESWGIQLWNHEGSPARLLFMVTGDDGNWIGVHGSFDLQLGQWYHIIATWDETSLRLYVNGVLDGSVPNTTTGVRDTDGGLVIGAQLNEMYSVTYGNLGWHGIIDRVVIRSDATDDGQALERYNNL